MNLERWGFRDLMLAEGEEAALTLGQHHGLSETPHSDSELVLLTTRRVFYLTRSGMGHQILVANLEDADVLQVSSAGRNLTTLMIGVAGLLGGVLGWTLLPETFSLAQWVSGALAAIGTLLLLLFLIMPEQGSLVFKTGATEIRMEFRTRRASRQASTLVNRFFALKEDRWRERHTWKAQAEAPYAPSMEETPLLVESITPPEPADPSTTERAEAERWIAEVVAPPEEARSEDTPPEPADPSTTESGEEESWTAKAVAPPEETRAEDTPPEPAFPSTTERAEGESWTAEAIAPPEEARSEDTPR